MKATLRFVLVLTGAFLILGLTPLSAQFQIGQTDSPPTIDGVVDASWESLATYVAVDPTTWTPNPDHQSLEDCSFTWTAVWDADSLYFLAIIKDDIVTTGSQAEGSAAVQWMNDNVEITINDPAGSENNVFFRFAFDRDGEDLGLLDDPPKATPVGSRYVTSTTDDGWLVEAAVPWDILSGTGADFSGYPALDKELNMNVYVADLDDPEGSVWDQLSGHVQWPYGWGATNVKLVETAVVDDVVPAAPANLASANVSHNSADLSWDASADAYGFLILAGEAPLSFVAEGTSTGTTLTGLAPETEFNISVLVSDGQNLSEISSTSFSTKAPPAPIDLDVDYYSGAYDNPFEDFDHMDALEAQPMDYLYGDANVDAMDLAGNMKVLWTATAFYMQVNVTDESLVNSGANPWENDNCEYHFDMGMERDGSSTEDAFDNFDPNNFQYRSIPQVADQTGSTPAPDWTGVGMATYDYYGDGVDVIGYTIEMSWPWNALNVSSGLSFVPSEGEAFAFDLKVSDKDEDGSSASITWSSFTHSDQYKNDAEFGVFTLKGGPTGMNDHAFDQGIHLYPNPASGMTSLRFDEPFSGTITLYDVCGKRVMEKSVNNTSGALHLDLGEFTQGLYMLSLENQKGLRSTRKLILK